MTGLRWAAVLGVLVLLGGAVLWTAARPGSITGTAVAGPPAGPPAAGDCLLEDPWLDDEADRTSGPLPALRVAPCTGARYGEVVSVGAATDLDAMWEDGSWDQCWRAIDAYLGLPQVVGTNPDRYPISSASPTLIGPDERQQAAGQDWSACVVGVPPGGPSDAAGQVHGSLRGSWHEPEGARFARCLDGPDSQELVACGRPHGAEQVSYSIGDTGRSPEAEAADCRMDAVDALGSADALDDGSLKVVVVNSILDEDTGEFLTGADARSAASGFYVDCMLAPAQPGRELDGPLRGLADGPVPLR